MKSMFDHYVLPERFVPKGYMLVLPSLHTRLSQKSKSNGAPTLLYVASAALRVADVTRILKDKKLRGEKGGDVAKLFAKHFKLAQHVSYLKRTKIGSAVGTPGRLGKLLNEESKTSTNFETKISSMKFVLLRCPKRIGRFPYYFGYYVQRYDDSKFTGHPRNERRNFWNHLEPCANSQRHQGRKDSGGPILITV